MTQRQLEHPSRTVLLDNASDAGLLVLRLAVAAVFIAHGWGDVSQDGGVGANVVNYRDAGIPLPEISAPFTAYVQLLGGAVVAFGALTRVISAGFVVVMAGALIFVHRGESLVMGQEGSGSGFAFSMCAASITLLLTGAGRFSLDRLYAQRRTRTAPVT
ncbi:DoxX family protein [Nonomuraea turkmeniaca]|uniref:DoxX family protein n=1 Tax=Nonomuraea turkmeniaca TaxID=103838 RepID=A0A5S4FIQ6_9ACTN|nr:DoxX family protein [Nonomuraea turkmeniaca]TMR20250.1 DoxX family protein [Nonomuraea turkmeniaca]